MAGRGSARVVLTLALALGILQAARGQTAPALEGERRLYAFEDSLTLDQQEKLGGAIAAIESHSGRHFFVIISRDPSVPLARATAADWRRRAPEDPQSAWRPESSILIVTTPGAEDTALELPPSVRDRLGLSPFTVRDQLIGPHFAVAARRGDLALALEKLLEAVEKWLADGEAAFGRESVAGLEDGDRGLPIDGVSVLSERLSNLEGRTLWLEAEGAELKSIETHLIAGRRALRSVHVAGARGEAAVKAAKATRDAIDLASSLVDSAETERAVLLDHCRRVRDAIDLARREVGGLTPELDAAQAAWSSATRERMRRPLASGRHLADAERALARARPIEKATPPPPPPPPLSITWRRLAAAFAALALVFGVGLLSVARATRAEARAAYLARRDEVTRDARELREVFDKLRDARDAVAPPSAVSIPGALAIELGLRPAGSDAKETFTLAAPPCARGETERLLTEAATGLAEIGAAWDCGERALGEAARVARSAGFLAADAFIKARRLLDLVPERVELDEWVTSVRDTIERLEDAPDEARAAIALMWSELQKTRVTLDQTVLSSVSPHAFEEDLATALELVADAVFAATADPVRAVLVADAGKEAAIALQATAERALATQLEISLVGDAVARIERLLDPGETTGHDPRGACERARGSLAEAAAALELGAPDEAQRELDHARNHLHLAEEMLARGEEVRRSGGSTVDLRRAEATDAKRGLDKAKDALAEIERDFAVSAADDVRPILDAAVATVPLLDAALDELAKEPTPLTSPQAHARLLRLDAHVTEIDRAARLVFERLVQLKETRDQLRARADEVERRLRELDEHAKQEDVSLRADTLERVARVREAVARVTRTVREVTPAKAAEPKPAEPRPAEPSTAAPATAEPAPAEAAKPAEAPVSAEPAPPVATAATNGDIAPSAPVRADVLALARELDTAELELEEGRLDVVQDAFLCRRVLSARKAAEESVRAADDSIRRGSDRVAGRARSRRARDLIEKIEPTLTSAQTDWYVVLEAYSGVLRASRAARELGSGKHAQIPDGELARAAAAAAIRRAERYDAPLIRADVKEAQSLLQRAIAEMGSNEAAAVDLAERAAAGAEEALRGALLRRRLQARAGERAVRELAHTHRRSRETLDGYRRKDDARRRAEWIVRRFARPAEPMPEALDEVRTS